MVVRSILGVFVLVVGIALFVAGLSVTPSPESDVSRLFTGSPSGTSMWLLISGAVSALLGLSLCLIPSKSRAQTMRTLRHDRRQG